MFLLGAKIRNFYHLGSEMTNEQPHARRFKVPYYQRPFKWPQKRIDDLLRDLFEHNTRVAEQLPIGNVGDGDDKYFAGAIVTVAHTDIHSLIDGQQRYTTAFLANYVQYLVFRVYVQVSLQERSSRAVRVIEHFARAAEYLFGRSAKQDLIDFLDPITRRGEGDDDSESDLVVAEYLKKVGLPEVTLDHPDFGSHHATLLRKHLKRTLNLAYDRQSFNEELVNALSAVMITLTSASGPTFVVVDSDRAESPYVVAMKSIFDGLCRQAEAVAVRGGRIDWKGNSRERTRLLIESAATFLDKLSFCVVQTGKDEDAYTLFEVLNDRSLALDDMDIVKNYFYRTYVLAEQNKNLSDPDEVLERLERVWGEQVFSEMTPGYLRTLTAYCAVTYLSGNQDLTSDKGVHLRAAAKTYLDGRRGHYSAERITCDFDAFRLTLYLLKRGINLPYAKRDQAAQDAFLDRKSSWIRKAILLAHALDLKGVLPALLNPILKKAVGLASSNVPEAEKFLDKLMGATSALEVYPELEKFAYYLSNLILASPDHERARGAAKRIIGVCSADGSRADWFPDGTSLHAEDLSEFHKWTGAWQYGQQAPMLRIRILMARLAFGPEPGTAATAFQLTTQDNVRLHLDHLEPANPPIAHTKAYFEHPDRARYINGLGNMMLLDSESNRDKSNNPMHTYEQALRDAGLISGVNDEGATSTHWMAVDVQRMLTEHHTVDPATGRFIPTTEFFDKRSLALRAQMRNLLSYPFEMGHAM